MKIKIVEIIDLSNGNARLVLDVDAESIMAFFKIGLIHVLETAAKQVIDQEKDIDDSGEIDEPR